MSDQVRELFETTLHEEPPLVDMVAEAISGARRRTRRDRIAMAVAPVAVLALGAGAYALASGLGPGRGARPTGPVSTPKVPVVFPSVAGSAPLNATPQVHQAALTLCTRDWSSQLKPVSSNNLPFTQQQAVDMCALTAEMLMTLIPDAKVEFPSVADLSSQNSPGSQFQVTTRAGRTIFDLWYLWPDSAYEKKHYGPFDECAPNPVDAPQATLVPGPDGKPFEMHNLNAGKNMYCFQTRPAQQFHGALTLNETDKTVGYSVVNRDYGRYLISTNHAFVEVPEAQKTMAGVYGSEVDGKMRWYAPDPDHGPALDLAQWSTVLVDPRFNDYLVRYENYVLTHASAESFTVSGSRPLAK